MTSSLEQSIKEKIRTIANERATSFMQLWQNLILERFLARLSQSFYRDRFVLKGGTLLGKYLPLGRETKDLDFSIQNIPNTEKSLEKALKAICNIDLQDSFIFEINKFNLLKHSHMPYTGAQIAILAKFGGTKTPIRIDLGFGDVVEVIDYSIDLTTSAKGPLFESKISLRCYPKEFIFAEKLETVLFRGEGNSRMKDFHDLYSLISLGDLNEIHTEKAIQLVFSHRKTSLKDLPVNFDENALKQLGKAWNLYHRRLKAIKNSILLPTSLENLIHSINQWLDLKTNLFHLDH